ncbi:MAG: flagellar basal body L-ring protein FlgH [Myxococcota bacterium]
MPRCLVPLALIAVVAASGCRVDHIKEYEVKQREYVSPVELEGAGASASEGSLFSARHQGSYLFADHRAMRKGDIVTVRVREKADAKRGASTELGRDSETNMEISAFLGLLDKLQNVMDDGKVMDLGSGTSFRGSGETSRSENLEATVPAIVRRVLPSGNLFIEGHRVVLVNNEEHHFYISGVVRPVDIQRDNSVPSSVIADAEIEFTGRGVVSEKQNPPWLQRGLDYIRPF